MISKISEWILFGYVIWIIKWEVYRDKLNNWAYRMDEKIKDRD